MEKVQVLISAYAFTLMANLIIGAIQYQSNKARIHLSMMAIWLSTLIILVFNILISTLGSVVAAMGAGSFFFVACMFHGSFFAQIAGAKFPKKLSLIIYGISCIGFFIALKLGVSLRIIIPVFVFACATPFYLSSYYVFKKRAKQGLSSPEKIYFTVQICIALHNLTWHPENNQDYQFIGFLISLALGQLDALIVPVVANNSIFKKRTDLLEEEISERVRELSIAKEQLLESNKLASLGRMAGGVAHEINNPLSLIQLQSDLIEKRARQNTLTNQFIIDSMEHIRMAVKRVTQLTLVLRRIARDENSKKLVQCDMASLIKEPLSLFEERIKDGGVQIDVQIPDQKVMISVDPSEITQVFTNLLDNSLDAVESLPDKFIKVKIAVDQTFASLIIEDSGRIPAEHRDRLMEPFFTTKPIGSGIGLSLALSKSIIDSHRGKLFLDKTSEFTRFIVHLPVEQSCPR